jgi:hypothetical protein
MDFSGDTFSSLAGAGFVRGVLTDGSSGVLRTSNVLGTGSSVGAGAVSTSGRAGSSIGVVSAD